MAISAISSRYAGFTFDGESSKTYGVYITDGGFYSAPIRDTEVVEIPGRNGAYILDKGRFKNIRVTYKAALGAENRADYISALASVRNWLCSKIGYVRLSDDFNPNEYRMATLLDGLDVSNLNPQTGEFDITFECMPQRFLTSGEIAQTMSTGLATITNPTAFPSKPMLEITGYGETDINGAPVSINSQPIGRVTCMGEFLEHKNHVNSGATFRLEPNYSSLNTGDDVEIELGGYIRIPVTGWTPYAINNFTQSGDLFNTPYIDGTSVVVPFKSQAPRFTFQLGTVASASATSQVSTENGGLVRDIAASISLAIDTAGVLTFTVTATHPINNVLNMCTLNNPGIIGDSTKSALGAPVYIDLDLGEAYKIENGEKIFVNNAISLPARLPELKPGINNVDHDTSTITDLKIVPRWWTV